MDENNTIISAESNVNVDKGGLYSVIATSIEGCSSIKKSILVNESMKPIIKNSDVEIVDDSNNNSIKIRTTGLGPGNYEFALLDSKSNVIIEYQSEPYFDNIQGGVYIVSIRDINGCGISSIEIPIITFPDFFTPNDDGENDTWSVRGVSKEYYKSAKISIFNRFGRVVAGLSLENNKWDGTFNGKKLMSNDYWFNIELIDYDNKKRIKNGNFSLIRN
jgi:gliding motility-associated-like protein